MKDDARGIAHKYFVHVDNHALWHRATPSAILARPSDLARTRTTGSYRLHPCVVPPPLPRSSKLTVPTVDEETFKKLGHVIDSLRERSHISRRERVLYAAMLTPSDVRGRFLSVPRPRTTGWRECDAVPERT